jgi:signal transduction histidine kinase
MRRLRLTLAVGIPLAVAFTAMGGYALAGRALAPIAAITSAASSIAAGERGLSTRIGWPRSDDEAGRLAATFDAMLGRLEVAFERERRFVADASHELRTPLTAIQAILGTVGAERRSADVYEEALKDIALETRRLAAVAEQLLVLARGGANDGASGRGEFRDVDLSTLLEDLLESFRPLAAEKGIALGSDVQPRLVVRGDMDALVRLFANLLDNAVKYTAAGKVTVTARRESEDAVSVEVADTGVGIAAEDLQRVFERFYRVERARSSPGAGLGLAIAQEIAIAHGTPIELSSSPGAGSRFTVRLPVPDARRGDITAR